MKEQIYSIIVFVAPLVSGFITSIVIPFLIKKIAVKRLTEKISKETPTEEIKELKEEIKELRKEILEMRGKRK